MKDIGISSRTQSAQINSPKVEASKAMAQYDLSLESKHPGLAHLCTSACHRVLWEANPRSLSCALGDVGKYVMLCSLDMSCLPAFGRD